METKRQEDKNITLQIEVYSAVTTEFHHCGYKC